MAHRNAKLTPLGRLLLVQRIMHLHWSVSQAAASLGVSRPTAYKWFRRWEQAGLGGLEEHSSRPQTSPRATDASIVEQILTLRRQLRWGPRRLAPLVGLHHSTVYAVLRQRGFSRLADVDRSSGIPIRYVRDHPGELLHLDMKPLGRIPPGGGHRVLGREAAPSSHRGLGYETIHVAVDDASRLAFAQILTDGQAETTARFLLAAAAFFAEQGIHIERIMTDRAFSYVRGYAFRDAVRELHLRHKVIRPYRPQTNGKAERFIRTMLHEWAYARIYRSNEERQEAFTKWLHYYNHHRPHTALGGQPPAAVSVNNVCRQHN